MSDVAEGVVRLWRDGLGPDDAAWVRPLLARASEPAIAGDPALPELRLFAAMLDVTNGVLTSIPTLAHPPVATAVAAAGRVFAARLARDVPALETAVEHLERALAGVAPDDPRAPSARAWADLALAEVAIALTDPVTARRRLDAVAADDVPLALRIGAMLRLAGLALSRFEVATARKLARTATTLAEEHAWTQLANRARLAWALSDYMSGDPSAMRKTLAGPIARGDVFSRLLLADFESAGRAMEILAEGLRAATERGDPMAYLMCVLVGARRYLKIGRDGDALVTISAGMAQLATIAPELAGVLAAERTRWKDTWDAERYAEAERKALEALDAMTS